MKKYIRVSVVFTPEGWMIPCSLTWADGKQYKIDRVTGLKPRGESKAEIDDRYTIRVHGRESYLYFERMPDLMGNRIGRWYVVR